MTRTIIAVLIVSLAAACRDKPEPAPPPAEEEQAPEAEEQEPEPAAAPDEASACSEEAIEGFFHFPPEAAVGGAWALCDFPDDMKSALKDLGNSQPAHRMAILVRWLSKDMSQLERVCPEAMEMFKGLEAVPFEQKSAWIAKQCGFEKLEIATADEMAAAPPSTLLVAAIVHGWLEEQDVEESRRIGRYILALE